MARGSNNVPSPALDLGLAPALRRQLALYAKALAGDLVLVVTPTTAAPKPTAATWTQKFFIELQTAAGEVHTWFNKTVTAGCSIADTSAAGTATCVPATAPVFVNGVAEIAVSGDAQAWLNNDTVTLTAAQQTILGYTVTAATGVVTFTT